MIQQREKGVKTKQVVTTQPRVEMVVTTQPKVEMVVTAQPRKIRIFFSFISLWAFSLGLNSGAFIYNVNIPVGLVFYGRSAHLLNALAGPRNECN
jgi:hypothetical protein